MKGPRSGPNAGPNAGPNVGQCRHHLIGEQGHGGQRFLQAEIAEGKAADEGGDTGGLILAAHFGGDGGR